MKLTWLPNAISIIRMFLVIVYISGAYFDFLSLWGILILGIIIILSDALDGMCARLLKAESLLGRILDSTADALFVVSSCIFFYLVESFSLLVLILVLIPRIAMGVLYIMFRISGKTWNTRHLFGDKLAGAGYYILILWFIVGDRQDTTSPLFIFIAALVYLGTFLSIKKRLS